MTTQKSTRSSSTRRRSLAVILCVAFATAMIMGPGPGLYLVNPDRDDSQAIFIIAGVPVLYLWALLWFFVQAAVVVVAYVTLWRSEE